MKWRGLCLFISLCAISCTSSQPQPYYLGPIQQYDGEIPAGQWLRQIPIEYIYEGKIQHAHIQIYFPKNFKRNVIKRTLIALHNTGSDMYEWERNSRITSSADSFGFVIVCPNMGVTLYETKFYPETTRKWAEMPGGKWIGEVLVPFLRKRFNLAQNRKYTAIVGISAAARGAVLVAEQYPNLFGAVGALSGYYDPTSLPKGSPHSKVYGEYENFQERWNEDDNVLAGAKSLLNTPVFIAHGKDDGHYHFEQSRLLAVKLLMLRNSYAESLAKTINDEENRKKVAQSAYPFELHLIRREYHNWPFWNFMIPQMMRFFDQHLEKNL